MMSALYVSKTGLAAQDKQLSTISNNLANTGTVGFKRDRAHFEDLIYQVQRQPGAKETQDSQLPSGLQLGTGTRVVATQKQFTQGNLQVTEQPLDLAINGRGFLQVLQSDGSIAYTRNGQLELNSEGQVVNSDGLVLEPAITVPQGTNKITIGKDGTVNAYTAGTAQQGAPGENGMGSLLQGQLESSNVDIVEEMVNMITTQRAYEMNSKVVSTADQMLQNIAQNL